MRRTAMRGRSLGVVLTLIAVVVLAVATFGRGGPPDPSIKQTVDTAQHLDSTKAHTDSVVKQAVKQADVAHQQVAVAESAVTRIGKDVARLQRSADSLAVLAKFAATAQDSARYWFGAYQQRTNERNALEGQLFNQRLATNQAKDEAAGYKFALDTTQARLRSLEWVNHNVATVVAKVNQCTLVLGIPCPTRTQAALGGLVAGAVVGLVSS